jgi:hypothetical protein
MPPKSSAAKAAEQAKLTEASSTGDPLPKATTSTGASTAETTASTKAPASTEAGPSKEPTLSEAAFLKRAASEETALPEVAPKKARTKAAHKKLPSPGTEKDLRSQKLEGMEGIPRRCRRADG